MWSGKIFGGKGGEVRTKHTFVARDEALHNISIYNAHFLALHLPVLIIIAQPPTANKLKCSLGCPAM